VTSGSIDELIMYFGDTTDPVTGERAISPRALQEFYTDPHVVFQRRQRATELALANDSPSFHCIKC
jgi:hypothetical protein